VSASISHPGSSLFNLIPELMLTAYSCRFTAGLDEEGKMVGRHRSDKEDIIEHSCAPAAVLLELGRNE
jgi:hypothetical protein